jgi:hypothetical protein
MIQYSLRCGNSHAFDSWFQSSEGFEILQKSGQINCPICADAKIEKTLMTPAVRPARMAGEGPKKPDLSAPSNDVEAALAEMRKQVEANSEYVGLNFVTEARRMHEGEIDPRAIYGEAKPDEARALIEDGVPVAPLPFMPPRKVN